MQKSNDSLKACFENVNIRCWTDSCIHICNRSFLHINSLLHARIQRRDWGVRTPPPQRRLENQNAIGSFGMLVRTPLKITIQGWAIIGQCWSAFNCIVRFHRNSGTDLDSLPLPTPLTTLSGSAHVLGQIKKKCVSGNGSENFR